MMSAATDSQSIEKGNVPETCSKKFFPTVHSYVTIKLDPIGSVAFMEDDEAATAAKDMVIKTYVGFLTVNVRVLFSHIRARKCSSLWV